MQAKVVNEVIHMEIPSAAEDRLLFSADLQTVIAIHFNKGVKYSDWSRRVRRHLHEVQELRPGMCRISPDIYRTLTGSL